MSDVPVVLAGVSGPAAIVAVQVSEEGPVVIEKINILSIDVLSSASGYALSIGGLITFLGFGLSFLALALAARNLLRQSKRYKD